MAAALRPEQMRLPGPIEAERFGDLEAQWREFWTVADGEESASAKTLLSPQWRVFYLALLVGLVTGLGTVVAAILMLGAMTADPTMAGPVLGVRRRAPACCRSDSRTTFCSRSPAAPARSLPHALRRRRRAADPQAGPLAALARARRPGHSVRSTAGRAAHMRRAVGQSRRRAPDRLQRYFSPMVVEHLLEGTSGRWKRLPHAGDRPFLRHPRTYFDVGSPEPGRGRRAPERVLHRDD